jgi:2-hydroxy-3-oxopropionate reductase
MERIGFIGLGINAIETGHEVGVPLPLTSQVMEIMQALRVDGKGQNDHGGIVQFYEKLAQIEARK